MRSGCQRSSSAAVPDPDRSGAIERKREDLVVARANPDSRGSCRKCSNAAGGGVEHVDAGIVHADPDASARHPPARVRVTSLASEAASWDRADTAVKVSVARFQRASPASLIAIHRS